MAHLDDENRRKGLKDLALTLLNIDDTIQVPYKTKERAGETYPVSKQSWELAQAKKWAKKKYGYNSVNEIAYDVLPRGVIVPYAIADAEWTFALYKLLRPLVEAHNDLYSLYLQEMELTHVLLEMEIAGMGITVPYNDYKVKQYAKRVLEHDWKIGEIVNKQIRRGKIPKKERADFFNPSSSSDDVRNWLTERGFQRDSYDAENLLTIDHPLATAVLELRDTEKTLQYFIQIRDEVIDGVLHPGIRQHGTRTGRVSGGHST